jgi:hypothetical protein
MHERVGGVPLSAAGMKKGNSGDAYHDSLRSNLKWGLYPSNSDRVGGLGQSLKNYLGKQMNMTKQESARDVAYLTSWRLRQNVPCGVFRQPADPLAENCGLRDRSLKHG